MTVRVATIVGPSGSWAPKTPNSALSPIATPIPAIRPITELSRPTTTASSSTARRTWPRLAPSIRISASSRVRWATSIENVLKMMKAPTNSAISAKVSRKVLKNARPSLTWSACSSASSPRR